MILNLAGQAASHSGSGDPFFIASVCYVMAASLGMVIRPQLFWRLNRQWGRAVKRHPTPSSPVTFKAYRIAGAIGLAAATPVLVLHLMRA
jgi:hypothetical protein